MSVKHTTRQEWEIIKKLDAEKKYGNLIPDLQKALADQDDKTIKRIIKKAMVVMDGWELFHALKSLDDKKMLAVAEQIRGHYQEPPKSGLDLGGVSITIKRSDDEDGPKLSIDTDSG
jgi:hypothetical protein